jgi:polynucleotide 5'-hydroxyl-kinase GRC3/NOL9
VSEMVVSPQWESLDLEARGGTVMVVGASDTGKSTLARYFFQKLCRLGLCVAYLDADMGQSTLGLPTTMSVALSQAAGDDRFPPRGPQISFFVGATTPRGYMLPTVVGAYRLQQKALALGAQAIVVDTTGLVDRAQGGKALKEWKIELLAPALVAGVQRGHELEAILWPLRRDRRVRVAELSVSPYAVERSREGRIARRRERLARYFERARPRSIALREWAVYDLEHLAGHTILALQDNQGFALGLGAVAEADREGGMVSMHTPLSSFDQVASIRFGAARWDLARQSEL